MPRETIACLLGARRAGAVHPRQRRPRGARAASGRAAEVPEPFRDVMRWTARAAQSRGRAAARGLAADAARPGRRAGRGVRSATRRRATTPRSSRGSRPRSGCCRSSTALGAPLVVCGHTHMQFDRKVGATRVVNAGSVGMPFGEPGAYWLLLGPGRPAAADALRSREGRRADPADEVSARGRVRRAQHAAAADRGGHARRVQERGLEVGAAASAACAG